MYARNPNIAVSAKVGSNHDHILRKDFHAIAAAVRDSQRPGTSRFRRADNPPATQLHSTTTDSKEYTTMSITLTDQDKTTLRTAAYGAVSLLTVTGSPHKAATEATIALCSATGLVGHVLASAKSRDIKLKGKSVAELADQVLPALTDAMTLLDKHDPAEADNFRTTINVAIEAATQARKGQPSPVMAEMTRKITEALDAA
ncbi:hypothetical protein [Nocardia sp. NPDC049707]|uniref:hypothetical protein n=1 Tax=Nocardia sp. NPDC049707 TaxID=3154735 RepID=UPI003439E009